MKVLPGGLIAIPLVLGRRPGAAVAGAAAATALLFGLLGLFMGADEGLRATLSWWRLASGDHSPQTLVEQGNCLRYNNQSLPITLARTFGAVGDVEIRGAVRVASLPLPLIWGAHKVLLAATGAAVLLLLGRLRGRGGNPDVWLGLFAAVCVGLLSPELRGLGVHLGIAYAIFGLVALDLWRRSAEPVPAAATAGRRGAAGATEARRVESQRAGSDGASAPSSTGRSSRSSRGLRSTRSSRPSPFPTTRAWP